MGRIAALAAVVAGVALSAAAGAKLHKNQKSVFDAASKSGRLVLIVYVTGDMRKFKGSQNSRDYMIGSPLSQRFLVRAFETAEIDVKKGGTAQLAAFRASMKRGNSVLPMWVVATPEGDFIDGGDNSSIDRGPKGWRAYMMALARKYPPIDPQSRKKADEMLKQAAADIDAARYVRAAKTLEKLQPVWFPKTFVEKCKDLTAAIKEKGIAAMAKADELNAGGAFLDAALAYERIKRQFSSRMPPGPAAAKKLRILLRQHKEIQEQFDRARTDEEAADLLVEARELVKADQKEKAMVAYRRLAGKYRDTPSAILAKEEMAKLGVAADGVKPASRPSGREDSSPDPEAKAERLLKLGKTYHNSGLSAKARQKLELCVKLYPSTASADEARKLLADFSGGGEEK